VLASATSPDPAERRAGRVAPRRRTASAAARDAVARLDLLRQNAMLRSVIEDISGAPALAPLLGRIVTRACALIGADRGAIGLVDETRQVVRTAAVHNMPDGELGSEAEPGVGLTGEVLRTGRPVIARRYGTLRAPRLSSLADDSVVGVPIVSDGRLIGVFGVGTAPGPDGAPARRLGRREIAVLELFAQHAAVAIENGRRYERERLRTERLALIARIGRVAASDLRLDEVLQRAADAIHELLGYPNVAIPLVDPADPEVLVLRTMGGHYKRVVRGEYHLPVSQGIIGAAARSRRTVLVNDVASDPRYFPTPGSEGIRAELAVPMLVGARVVGVLNVESAAPFDAEDAAGLEIVADQLAAAVENARLYAAAQRAAAIEERQRIARDLHDSVTQTLFSLRLIAESAGPAWRRDAAEGERRTARVLELSEVAFAEMRALLAELWPREPGGRPDGSRSAIARVAEDGLAQALAWHVDGVRRDHPRLVVGFDARRYGRRHPPLPLAHEEALFRIAQEAAANAVRHAGGTRLELRVASDARGARLEIVDDGVGFDARRGDGSRAARRADGGYGLTSMRERAQALGGHVRVSSAPGRGTVVRVRLPRPELSTMAMPEETT
jgi:signal transduction histidine kinase